MLQLKASALIRINPKGLSYTILEFGIHLTFGF